MCSLARYAKSADAVAAMARLLRFLMTDDVFALLAILVIVMLTVVAYWVSVLAGYCTEKTWEEYQSEQW